MYRGKLQQEQPSKDCSVSTGPREYAQNQNSSCRNWSSEVPTETENLMQLFGMQNVETSAVHHSMLQKVCLTDKNKKQK